MKNYTRWAALFGVCVLLTGCGLLSPEQQQNALEVIDQMRDQGTISSAQHEVLSQGILSQGWSGFLEQLSGYALAAVAAYTGVMIRRGPPTRQENIAKKAEPVAAQPTAS